MEQKLVLIETDRMDNLNELLSQGFKIISISACGTGAGGQCYEHGSPYCYVLLEKNK